ncbi:MAG TPA: FAD-binding protein [Candidatus Omnitrophota bacterium]|nr:FAD-binding protein [Candidatus Omnitrophota bacterium]
MGLKIITLMKQVPLPTEMRMGADGLMDRTKAKSMINADCAFGLEQGLQIRKHVPDAEMIVISMGPPSFEQSLKRALAMGYDRAVLLSDRKLGGSDTFATGYAISSLIKKLGLGNDPYIIFSGRQTTDGDTAHVPSQTAENLRIPQATFVEKVEWQGDHLKVRRIIEGGYQILRLPIPCLISIAPTATPARRPSLEGAIRARNTKLEVWTLDQTGADSGIVGINGSPTLVAKVVDILKDRPPVNMISGHEGKDLADGLVAEVEKIKDQIAGGHAAHSAQGGTQQSSSLGKATADFPRVDFRGGARGVLTWIEMHGQIPARSSMEILNPARRLADQLETKVRAVIIGHNVKGAAQEVIEHGADEVVLVDDPRLKEYSILPTAAILSQIIEKNRPEIALFGATTSGRELAPRLGSRVKAGVTADCTSLEIGEYAHRLKKSIFYPCLESIRPTYGESKLATIIGFWCPQMATARAGTFKILPRDIGRKGIVSEFKPVLTDKDFIVEILETKREAGGGDNLFVADIVISGGRPAGEHDDFKLIKELVEALREKGINADWGASRHAVDNGYAPYARQVGQTGKTIRPKLYIAVAISGAIQHLAGMKESGKIIAINQDPQAAIFRHADFGMVRDYREVLPALIAKVKQGFTFGLSSGK